MKTQPQHLRSWEQGRRGHHSAWKHGKAGLHSAGLYIAAAGFHIVAVAWVAKQLKHAIVAEQEGQQHARAGHAYRVPGSDGSDATGQGRTTQGRPGQGRPGQCRTNQSKAGTLKYEDGLTLRPVLWHVAFII